MFNSSPLILVTPSTADPALQEISHYFQDKGFDCRLQTPEEYVQQLADQLPLGIFHTNETGQIEYANECCERMSGYPLKDWVGDRWFQIIHPADQLRIQEEVRDLLADPRFYATSAHLINSEGDEIFVYIVFNPHWHEVDSKRLQGFWGVFFNISEYLVQHHVRERSFEYHAVQHENATSQTQHGRNILIAKELQFAIERNELYLMYQPQIYVGTEKLAGYEVLLRWNNKILGNVSPNEFIPIAERTGLISKVGTWVFEHAIEQHAKWLNEYYQTLDAVKLSINLSPEQLQNNNLLEWIAATLVKHDLKPKQIMIELTETAIMRDFERNLKVINELRALGLGVSMDDFGTGYSSLTFLGKLPITQLKIDQSFIHTINQTGKGAAIVKAIILLADALDIQVVAEGVETEEELKYLQDNTCHIIQGYYYSKPLTASDMDLFISMHV